MFFRVVFNQLHHQQNAPGRRSRSSVRQTNSKLVTRQLVTTDQTWAGRAFLFLPFHFPHFFYTYFRMDIKIERRNFLTLFFLLFRSKAARIPPQQHPPTTCPLLDNLLYKRATNEKAYYTSPGGVGEREREREREAGAWLTPTTGVCGFCFLFLFLFFFFVSSESKKENTSKAVSPCCSVPPRIPERKERK